MPRLFEEGGEDSSLRKGQKNINVVKPVTAKRPVPYRATTNAWDGFRTTGQRFLLTYSQLRLETFKISELGQHLMSLFNNPVTCVLAAKEKHKDGGDHVHIYLDVGIEVQIQGSRFFDYCQRHPHIKAITKTPHRAAAYVMKDEKVFFRHGEVPGKRVVSLCQQGTTSKHSFERRRHGLVALGGSSTVSMEMLNKDIERLTLN
ncbi:hypothetical protein PV08_06397 [Exophiala spinifera]|uniref:CRESS-DNA virus Rep endonuclease domain-containing protein n=1 Tax=Exophiala spinifera TaxID=91928 RepID=A0A0D1YMS2_9EURO|nr:uncharacterized protein PV08_06397 [Exophiala spinifera]KIW16346.1 hypothetical protein PV08_06397 [Exophiala spinifera]